jgi:acetate kinase
VDPRANEDAIVSKGAACITRADSLVPAWVVATDEETVIALRTMQAYRASRATAAPPGDRDAKG